jgi:hypothetical protein
MSTSRRLCNRLAKLKEAISTHYLLLLDLGTHVSRMYADVVDGTGITSSSIAEVSKMIEMLKISIDEIEKTYRELLKTYEESIREKLLNPRN